ncbi:unnamed protein product [Linum tenue]|uniref:Uncharacterized protein n=1 Tax=Linum tenue TaxID=586396 RepID=A0AAV0L295_9ROSI|nr:unnamed protein product [Linum tenue]
MLVTDPLGGTPPILGGSIPTSNSPGSQPWSAGRMKPSQAGSRIMKLTSSYQNRRPSLFCQIE